jgi:hypothetical protein
MATADVIRDVNFVVSKTPEGFQVLREVRHFRRFELVCFIPKDAYVEGRQAEQLAHQVRDALLIFDELNYRQRHDQEIWVKSADGELMHWWFNDGPPKDYPVIAVSTTWAMNLEPETTATVYYVSRDSGDISYKVTGSDTLFTHSRDEFLENFTRKE